MFYENLTTLCRARGTTPTTLCKILGLSTSLPTMWKSGRIPRLDTAKQIADYFEISVDSLLTDPDTHTDASQVRTNVLRVPVLGKVAAGIPIEAIEEIEDYEELDADRYPTGEYYGLVIRGHSMEPRIADRDIVIVRKQADINSGDIAIVMVNGQDATCKRILKDVDGICLVPLNPAYPEKFYSNKEIEELPVCILGKVVELRAKL